MSYVPPDDLQRRYEFMALKTNQRLNDKLWMREIEIQFPQWCEDARAVWGVQPIPKPAPKASFVQKPVQNHSTRIPIQKTIPKVVVKTGVDAFAASIVMKVQR